MKWFLFAFTVLVVLLFVTKITAEYSPYDYSNEFSLPGGRGNTTIDQVVQHPLKFHEWYSGFGQELDLISKTVCNLSLAAYEGNHTARVTLGPIRDYCWVHTNCLLTTISEHAKASFAGTSILLGLAPTTLSVLGPSVAEMALLSIHRPFLSLLLSLGAPAVYPGRFLQWEDPLRANEPSTGAFIVRPFSKYTAIGISIFQYVAALACCANVFQATYRIGVRSVLAWSCSTSYWPSLWVLCSLVIHLTATVSLRAAITRKKTYSSSVLDDGTAIGDGREQKKRSGQSLLRSEFTLSANSDWQVSDVFDVKLGPFPVALQYTGAFLSVVYLVFGTLLFASLLFISVGNAAELIFRLISSTIICRIILQFEVGGMIKVDESRLYKSVVQPQHTEKNE